MYFSIPRLQAAIKALERFDSRWVLIPLVFAVNGVNDTTVTRMRPPLHPGTDAFLDKYFRGELIGLSPYPTGKGALRPRFKEIVKNMGDDLVIHQSQKLWANLYSRAGYNEMALSGDIINHGQSSFQTQEGFWERLEAELTPSWKIENLLVWLYAFDGLPETVSSWKGLLDHFWQTNVGSESISGSKFKTFFALDPGIPWPDLIVERPTDHDFQKELLPSHIGGAKPPSASAAASPLVAQLRRRGQLIFEGPPGVGKTHQAFSLVEELSPGAAKATRLSEITREIDDNTVSAAVDEIVERDIDLVWEVVQFHPSMAYEDFVRGIEADTVQGSVYFRPRNRVMGLMCGVGSALRKLEAECQFLLIIDEINRADIARVFGDLIFGLEYRDQPVVASLSVDGDASLNVPSNLMIVGTMNTLDRSISQIDYALRRRFGFVQVRSSVDVIEASSRFESDHHRRAAVALYEVVKARFSDPTGSGDAGIGHAYFLPSVAGLDEEAGMRDLAQRFAYEILPLLLEYQDDGLVSHLDVADLLDLIGCDEADRSQGTVEEAVLLWVSELEGP